MLTTYELIRRLAQVDPDGDCQVMVSIKTQQGDKECEVNSFIDEIWVERPEEVAKGILVLSGIDE